MSTPSPTPSMNSRVTNRHQNQTPPAARQLTYRLSAETPLMVPMPGTGMGCLCKVVRSQSSSCAHSNKNAPVDPSEDKQNSRTTTQQAGNITEHKISNEGKQKNRKKQRAARAAEQPSRKIIIPLNRKEAAGSKERQQKNIFRSGGFFCLFFFFSFGPRGNADRRSVPS